MTDFAVFGGLESHSLPGPITSLGWSTRMTSPALIVCNRRESRLADAPMGRRGGAMGRRPI